MLCDVGDVVVTEKKISARRKKTHAIKRGKQTGQQAVASQLKIPKDSPTHCLHQNRTK